VQPQRRVAIQGAGAVGFKAPQIRGRGTVKPPAPAPAQWDAEAELEELLILELI
jgi:hypothetical protein